MPKKKIVVCDSCGQAFPVLSSDEKLAEKLRNVFYNAHGDLTPNYDVWHQLSKNERKAWLAVVQAARKDLIDVQGPIRLELA